MRWRGGKPLVILFNDGDVERWRGGSAPISVQGDLYSVEISADGFIPYEFTADGIIGGRSLELDCDGIIVDRYIQIYGDGVIQEPSGRLYPIRKSPLLRIYPLT